MLVLSRRKNESLVIGDDITIVIVEIRGDKVRLGIEAPKEVPVHRTEVYQAIRRCTAEDYCEPRTPVPPDERREAIEHSPEPTTVAVRDAEPSPRDGLCCPQCQSEDVRIERIKVAYKGAELVRWRECGVCGNRFQTLEKVQEL